MPKVLIIDDDEKLVKLLTEYLEPHGFTMLYRLDGKAGFAAAVSEEPDLVVLDVMLPGLDGFEVCRRIRGKSQVPILMLTARGEETDRIVGLELGADDYLSKPFNPRELLARIRAILRRAERSSSTPVPHEEIVVGPVVLDVGARTVTVRGQPVELTTAEFDLLRVLLEGAGRVLSRDQLMERLHGSSWSYFDRSIDVHISRIRQKIEREPKRPSLLKTVRGVGYQFVRHAEEGGT